MNTIKLDSKNKPLMVAHRGVSGLEPENTLSAFIAAGNRSYFGIESDVRKTADGKFILSHDNNTKRESGVDLEVEATDFDTLRAVNLYDIDGKPGRVDLHMASLKEYIRTCKKYEKIAVLELKNSFTDDELRNIYNEINEENYVSGTIFIAFDINNLLGLRKIDATVGAQFLTWSPSEDLIKLLTENKLDLDIHYKNLTRELADECHANGIKINVWTVNTPEEASVVIDYGVDFITTNILE